MFFGYRAPTVPSHAARRLKLDDPRTVQHYQEVLDKYLEDNNIYQKTMEFQKEVKRDRKFSQKSIELYETIDAIRYKAKKYAERKCRKLWMGGRQWYPTLQKARDTILLWTLVQRKLFKRKVSAHCIVCLKKKLKISDTQITAEKSYLKLDEAYTNYKKVRKIDKKLSKSYREELATARTEAGNTTLATEIRNLNI